MRVSLQVGSHSASRARLCLWLAGRRSRGRRRETSKCSRQGESSTRAPLSGASLPRERAQPDTEPCPITDIQLPLLDRPLCCREGVRWSFAYLPACIPTLDSARILRYTIAAVDCTITALHMNLDGHLQKREKQVAERTGGEAREELGAGRRASPSRQGPHASRPPRSSEWPPLLQSRCRPSSSSSVRRPSLNCARWERGLERGVGGAVSD